MIQPVKKYSKNLNLANNNKEDFAKLTNDRTNCKKIDQKKLKRPHTV